MIISPKIRGFICTTAHPDGCESHVRQQVDYVKSKATLDNSPKKVLVIGSLTGYGLASRIVPAFAGGADTLGVFFERPANEKKSGSPGWYNSYAFEELAKSEGLYAKSINGDAFSDDIKNKTIEEIKKNMGQVDCVIYSLASPRRQDPKSGEIYKSCLKPIGQTYTQKTVNTDKAEVEEITIESANDDEINQTVKVMGGEDWELWIDALREANVLAPLVTTMAYSYIGPELTWSVYKDGTIGRAKIHLEQSCQRINEKIAEDGGRAYVSVNKAVVTQASSAIPVVPLYISVLFKKMKEEGIHEDCIEQIYRLFSERLSSDPQLDSEGRIRIDDWEMRDDIQQSVAEDWEKINTDNLSEISDFEGYQSDFLKLFGFGIPGINYDAETDPIREIDLVQ
ncbi:MAG: enoyl-ACP reductase FabV [Verrucomicrobiota bacterium]|nr:enoyl-ACP reductase FabV [Verrucomicrobiota bacterium]